MDAFNALSARIEATNPIGPLVTDSPAGPGRYISAPPQGKSGLPTPPNAFALYDASKPDAPAVGVRFGNVSCYARVPGVQPWPNDFNAATTPPYTCELAVTGDGAVWIAFTNTYTAGIPAVSDISIDNGSTVPDDTDTVTYLVLGNYTYSADAGLALLNPMGIGDQYYDFCGGVADYRPA